jgi:hypothetical protein
LASEIRNDGTRKARKLLPGENLGQPSDKAREYFQKAADAGYYPPAMHKLGVLCAKGEGIAQTSGLTKDAFPGKASLSALPRSPVWFDFHRNSETPLHPSPPRGMEDGILCGTGP